MELYLSSLRREYSVDSFEIIDDTARLPMSSFTKVPERGVSFSSSSSSSSSFDIDSSLSGKMSRLARPSVYHKRRCRWSGSGVNREEHHPRRFSEPDSKQDRSPTPPVRR